MTHGQGILLVDYLETWQTHRHHLRPSTTIRDDSYIRNHIVPELGGYRLDRLTRTIVKAWVTGRVSAGYAPATIRKAAGILSTALDDAVDDGLIALNPATKLDLPKIEANEQRFLTNDEVWRLADTIDPRYRVFVLTGAFTGMRPGELRALRLDHLNMLGRTIQVEETLAEDSGRIAAGPVKTAASRRQIKLPGSSPTNSPDTSPPTRPETTATSSRHLTAARSERTTSGDASGYRPSPPPGFKVRGSMICDIPTLHSSSHKESTRSSSRNASDTPRQ